MKPTLVLLCFIFTALRCFSQVTNDEKVRYLVNEDGQAEVSVYNSPDILKKLSENTSVSTVKDGRIFIRLSRLTIEWFIKQKFDYKIVEKQHFNLPENAKSTNEALEWDTYPTYTQYLDILTKFSTDYPSLCELDTIGTSINGKLILALKISDNASDDEDEPEVFYSSTIHGDETAGFVLMLRLADYILSSYSTSDRIRNLADNLEIWINPLANPDGTYRNGNTIADPVRFNSNGYDLNRNFPDPMSPYNQNNVQQKETKEMVDFLKLHRFVLSANFHSGVEVVNYPWDAFERGEIKLRSSTHADNTWFYRISRAYVDTVYKYSDALYMKAFKNGVTEGANWYVIYGGRQDFVTWELQGREVTIELDYIDNYPLVTPTARLPLLWEYNYRSLIVYLENALYGIHGEITDANDGRSVAAMVFINGHDKDNSHVYSDTTSGRFVRFLDDGVYDVTFSAGGYADTTITDVEVFWHNKKLLPVTINRLRSNNSLSLYPNPAFISINALLPANMEGPVRIQIFNTSGMLVKEVNDNFIVGIPLNIPVKNLAGGTYIIVFTNIHGGTSVKTRFVVTGN
ncbi:MAG TPA: M14 family zinc carboxypeptidase [Bacteroidales bacterium]|nr:M14 family zinc carboxypeptidase [Bacteroidales bacterium]